MIYKKDVFLEQQLQRLIVGNVKMKMTKIVQTLWYPCFSEAWMMFDCW